MDAVVSLGKLQWRFRMDIVPRTYERMWLPAVDADGGPVDLLVQVGYVCWDVMDNRVDLDCVFLETDGGGPALAGDAAMLDSLKAVNPGA